VVLGFKNRFAAMIEEGSKTHSIREDAGDRWRIGCYVDAFINVRTKAMKRLLPPCPVIRTESIEIFSTTGFHDGIVVTVDGVQLSMDEKNLLAFRDGFRTPGYTHQFYEMADFWSGRMPFKGKIIHWLYKPAHVEPTAPPSQT
jgi:hypothetical protein